MIKTIDIRFQNEPERMHCTVFLWLLFLVSFDDLNFILTFKYELRTHATPFLDTYQHRGYELFVAGLPDPSATKAKMVFLPLAWHVTGLKMLNMD